MFKKVIIGVFGVIIGGVIGYFIKGKKDKKEICNAKNNLTMAYKVYSSVNQVERETSNNLMEIEKENFKKEELRLELWEGKNKLEEVIEELKMLKEDAEMQDILKENELNENGITEEDISKIMSDAMKLIMKARETLED